MKWVGLTSGAFIGGGIARVVGVTLGYGFDASVAKVSFLLGCMGLGLVVGAIADSLGAKGRTR